MALNNDAAAEHFLGKIPTWMDADNEFTQILRAQHVLFYCPTCDAMAYIGRLSFFKPAPWRADVFCWRNPAINKPDVKRKADI